MYRYYSQLNKHTHSIATPLASLFTIIIIILLEVLHPVDLQSIIDTNPIMLKRAMCGH